MVSELFYEAVGEFVAQGSAKGVKNFADTARL